MLSIQNLIAELEHSQPYQSGAALWTDTHIAGQMLVAHISPDTDAASYKPSTIQAICRHLPQAMGLKAGDAVIDLGCGPGLYCHQLAGQGLAVTGIDWSENSLRYARELCRGQSAQFRQANYLQPFGREQYDAALLIYQDYGVLSPSQRKTLLHNIHTALRPGGHFAVDVCSLADYARRERQAVSTWETAQEGFWRPHPYLALHTSHFYPEIPAVCDLHGVLDDGATVYRVWQTFYSPASIEQELRESGFALEAIWSHLNGEPWWEDSPVIGVLCRKV